MRQVATPDASIKIEIPRPRVRDAHGAQIPDSGNCSASTAGGGASTTALGVATTPLRDTNSTLCVVDCRTTSTVEDVAQAVARQLPVPVSAVAVEAKLAGAKVDAPRTMTCWELGLDASRRLRWRLDIEKCFGDDDDDDARFGDDPVEALFARKFDIQPKHPIGTGPLGPPLRVRADETIGTVVARLCDANPGLRNDCVVPVRHDAAAAAAQQARAPRRFFLSFGAAAPPFPRRRRRRAAAVDAPPPSAHRRGRSCAARACT